MNNIVYASDSAQAKRGGPSEHEQYHSYSMVDDWLNYAAVKGTYSVLAKEDFESRFEATLREHTANIKEEIEFYGK